MYTTNYYQLFNAKFVLFDHREVLNHEVFVTIFIDRRVYNVQLSISFATDFDRAIRECVLRAIARDKEKRQ